MINLKEIESRARKAHYPTSGNVCMPALGKMGEFEIVRSRFASDSPERVIGVCNDFETGFFWAGAKHDVLTLISRVRELEEELSHIFNQNKG